MHVRAKGNSPALESQHPSPAYSLKVWFNSGNQTVIVRKSGLSAGTAGSWPQLALQSGRRPRKPTAASRGREFELGVGTDWFRNP